MSPKPRRKRKQSPKPGASTTHVIHTQAVTRTLPPYIVDTIFPCNELHLIGGPAQSGKTTLLLQIMDDWQRGVNVFGYTSYPRPACYISCVHSLAMCRTTLAHIGAPDIPAFSLVDTGLGKDFDEIYSRALNQVPNLEVIFLDGILRLCKGSTIDNGVVGDFLSGLIRKLQEYHVTVIATGRCAKPRESSNGHRPIDKFLGATAWTEYSSCFIAVELDAKTTDPRDTRRKVSVLPKCAPATVLNYRFSPEGRLVEVPQGDNVDGPTRMEILEAVLSARDPGTRMTTMEITATAADIGIVARSTLMSYLQILVRQGKLQDGGYGVYIIPSVN